MAGGPAQVFGRKARLANKAGRVARAHGGKQNEVAVIWFAKVWGGGSGVVS